jgi:hypothetical protein
VAVKKGPHPRRRNFVVRSSEPKPHWINKLPVSYDSEIR